MRNYTGRPPTNPTVRGSSDPVAPTLVTAVCLDLASQQVHIPDTNIKVVKMETACGVYGTADGGVIGLAEALDYLDIPAFLDGGVL